MKAVTLIVGLMIFLNLLAPAPASADQVVSIKLAPWEVHSRGGDYNGHHIGLSITLTDLSSRPLQILEHDNRETGEGSYLLDVRDTSGDPAPLTEYGRMIYGGPELFVPGAYRATTLEPGKPLTVSVWVDKVYDMSQPGTYTITASRRFDGESGPRYVQSNSVTVTVP